MEGASRILTTLARNSPRAALVLGSERMGVLNCKESAEMGRQTARLRDSLKVYFLLIPTCWVPEEEEPPRKLRTCTLPALSTHWTCGDPEGIYLPPHFLLALCFFRTTSYLCGGAGHSTPLWWTQVRGSEHHQWLQLTLCHLLGPGCIALAESGSVQKESSLLSPPSS